jgi:protein ImuB
MGQQTEVRVLVVWCPDWPAVAAMAAEGLSPLTAVVVVNGSNAVTACSAAARAEGVRIGHRRRAAQSRFPDLVVCADDPDRDAREFAPVVAAVQELAPELEVVEPGLVALPARGPATYFGGAEAAAERLIDQVAERTCAECQIGMADGLFAATLAAHRGRLVPAGQTAAFLAPLSITELVHTGQRGTQAVARRAELIDVARRLGLHTLGAFADLPERDVASRFGAEAVLAHRLARGLQHRPLARTGPTAELVVVQEFDPPVTAVEPLAFAARGMAEQLHTQLAAAGVACTRLAIGFDTTTGEGVSRVWRCAEPVTVAGVAERIRWQAQGWAGQPSGPIVRVEVVAEEVIDRGDLAVELWSGQTDADERAARALTRVQGLLGPEGVVTAVLQGGRTPREQTQLVPWGESRDPQHDPVQPWPGQLHRPFPVASPARRTPAVIYDETGSEIAIAARHQLSGAPVRVVLDDGAARQVVSWAGPWPMNQRWWTAPALRVARLQVLTTDCSGMQSGLLLCRADGQWWVEGIYE